MDPKELDRKISNLYNKDEVFEEGVMELVDKIIIKIKLILSKMKEDWQNIKKEVKLIANRASLNGKLKQMKAQLNSAQAQNKKTIKMINYNKFLQYYNRHVNTIAKKISRLSDYRKFKTAGAFLAESHDLEKAVMDMDKELVEIENNPIDVPLKDAIDFVENEALGESKIIAQYMGCEAKLETFVNKYERCLRDARAASNWYMDQQHAGVFQRGLSSCSKIMSKHCSKFIALTVFKFA